MARGIVETLGPGATIRLPAGDLPPTWLASDFTVLVWVWPEAGQEGVRGVVQVPGVFSLLVADDGQTLLAQAGASGGPEVTASAAFALPAGQWSLLGASYTRSTGELRVWGASEGVPTAEGYGHEPDLAGLNLGPATSDFGIGAHPSGAALALEGAYGLVALRAEAIEREPFEALFTSRRYFAGYAETTADGVERPGMELCVWMMNHAMASKPIDGGVGGTPVERAAIPGWPVGMRNVHVFDRGRWFEGGEADNLIVVRPVSATADFAYGSHHDAPYAGFFVRDLPAEPVGFEPVAAVAPLTRMLALGEPDRPIRMIASANSRGMRRGDGTGVWPNNYAHGFIDFHRHAVSGVLFRPAIETGGPSGRWFGFDAHDQGPFRSGTVFRIENLAQDRPDFTRFWTGSGRENAPGPGSGVWVSPGGRYSMRCRPEPGSLLLADSPLHVEAYVMRYPGSTDTLWVPVRGTGQGGAPVWSGSPSAEALDTTAHARILTADDTVASPAEVRLSGDLTGQLQVGWACFVAAGAGQGSISVVEQVSFDGERTRVIFEQPFGLTPATGSELRFGPWGFVTVAHEFAPIDPGDNAEWRGIEFRPEQGGGGLVVLAFSAWRPQTAGLIIGGAGWGGNGYTRQIGRSFRDALVGWIALTQADVWIQAPAQQGSQPSAMNDFTDAIRVALPAAEIVWAGEMAHTPNSHWSWHAYIAAHASAAGVVGVTVYDNPKMGTAVEQNADGIRSDKAHLTRRGNEALARLWCELLLEAAIERCPADFNGDTVIDTLDFLAFLNAFAAGDMAADFNGDTVVNTLDFIAYLNAYVIPCP